MWGHCRVRTLCGRCHVRPLRGRCAAPVRPLSRAPVVMSGHCRSSGAVIVRPLSLSDHCRARPLSKNGHCPTIVTLRPLSRADTFMCSHHHARPPSRLAIVMCSESATIARPLRPAAIDVSERFPYHIANISPTSVARSHCEQPPSAIRLSGKGANCKRPCPQTEHGARVSLNSMRPLSHPLTSFQKTPY